jgi:hypothetical protein
MLPVHVGRQGRWKVYRSRWSRAAEKKIVTNETMPTQLFYGYGRLLAHLYKG